MASPSNADLSKIPIMPNPSGAPSNFTGGPSLHDEILEVGVVLIVFSGLFLILRLVTNVKVARKVGCDDGELLRSAICYMTGLTSEQVLCIFAFVGGVGYWALNFYSESNSSHRILRRLLITTCSVQTRRDQTCMGCSTLLHDTHNVKCTSNIAAAKA